MGYSVGACTKSRTILGNVAAQDELAALRIVPCRHFNFRDAEDLQTVPVGEGIRNCRPVRLFGLDPTTQYRRTRLYPSNKDKRYDLAGLPEAKARRERRAVWATDQIQSWPLTNPTATMPAKAFNAVFIHGYSPSVSGCNEATAQGCLRAGDQSPAWIIGNRPFHFTFSRMPKKPTRIEIIEEGDQRFLLKTFADGKEKREPIVKLPRKTRPRPKVDWSRKYSSGLKRGF